MANRLFHLYRYQIIPNERIQERLPFGDMTVEEVIQNKNAFLSKPLIILSCRVI